MPQNLAIKKSRTIGFSKNNTGLAVPQSLTFIIHHPSLRLRERVRGCFPSITVNIS